MDWCKYTSTFKKAEHCWMESLSFLFMAQNTNTVYMVLHLDLFTFVINCTLCFFSLGITTVLFSLLQQQTKKATDNVSQ